MCSMYESLGLWMLFILGIGLGLAAGTGLGWKASAVRFHHQRTKPQRDGAKILLKMWAKWATAAAVVVFFGYAYLLM